MTQHYTFDWTEFTRESLEEVNYFEKEMEDSVYGFLPFSVNGKQYIADIHYYYYGYKNHGFSIDVWTSNEHGAHCLFVTEFKDIKSATNYRRFCRRVEDLITNYFLIDSDEPEEVEDVPAPAQTQTSESFPKQETEMLMHLSTAHIKPETFDWLISVCYTDELLCPFMVYEKTSVERRGRIVQRDTTGFFIHLVDADETELDEYDMPEDFVKVLRAVANEHINWLVLDHDAPCASDYHWDSGKNLPVYHWSA